MPVHPLARGVYALMGVPGYIKIGKAQGIAKRIADLQIGHPAPLRLLSILSDDVRHEGVFHRHFAASRSHGEWFRVTEELVELVVETRTRPEQDPLYLLDVVRRRAQRGDFRALMVPHLDRVSRAASPAAQRGTR